MKLRGRDLKLRVGLGCVVDLGQYHEQRAQKEESHLWQVHWASVGLNLAPKTNAKLHALFLRFPNGYQQRIFAKNHESGQDYSVCPLQT